MNLPSVPDLQPPPVPRLAADPAAIAALSQEIALEPVTAVDTESNSFHVYRERVCLLQVSTGRGDWVIDPLVVDVRPLGGVLTDGREVVLHGADYDIRCLKREYGWEFPAVFDTMAAARRLGQAALGLSALVEQHFGVRLPKDHQRSDWGRRPLSNEQIRYASRDTHYLLGLREKLLAGLRERGLEAQAREEFRRIAAVVPRPKVFDPEGYRRLRAGRDLDPPGKAVLKALWVSRERRASDLDRPPFKVLGEQAMVEIARRRPRTAEELTRIPGVTTQVLRRVGDIIFASLEEGARG